MCTIVIIGLSVGIFFIQITTDPVELWAAPHRFDLFISVHFENEIMITFEIELIAVDHDKKKITMTIRLVHSIEQHRFLLNQLNRIM